MERTGLRGTAKRRFTIGGSSSRRYGGIPVWILPTFGVLALAGVWLISRSSSFENQRTPEIGSALLATPSPVKDSRTVREDKTPPGTQLRTDAVDVTEPPPNPVKPSPQSKVVAAASTRPLDKPNVQQGGNKLPPDVDKLLIGEWTGYYQGDRHLKVAADGTGTMVAQPEGIAATLLAAKLTFQIKWKRTGDQLEFETVVGEPLDKVNVVVKMYGRRRTHQILDVQPNQFLLLDEDGVTRYVWKRVEPQSKSNAVDSQPVRENAN